MKNRELQKILNKEIDLEEIALFLIKGDYKVLNITQTSEFGCGWELEADLLLPNGVRITFDREGWKM